MNYSVGTFLRPLPRSRAAKREKVDAPAAVTNSAFESVFEQIKNPSRPAISKLSRLQMSDFKAYLAEEKPKTSEQTHQQHQQQPVADWRSYVKGLAKAERDRVRDQNRVRVGSEMAVSMVLTERLNYLAMRKAFCEWRGTKTVGTADQAIRHANARWTIRIERDRMRVQNHARSLAIVQFERISRLYRTNSVRDWMRTVLQDWYLVAVPEKLSKEEEQPVPAIADLYYAKAVTVVKKKKAVVAAVPIESMYLNYHSKGRVCPIDIKVRAYASLGYPMWYLARMLTAREKNIARMAANAPFLNEVFDKYMKSKPTKSKPKTAMQKMHTKHNKK